MCLCRGKNADSRGKLVSCARMAGEVAPVKANESGYWRSVSGSHFRLNEISAEGSLGRSTQV